MSLFYRITATNGKVSYLYGTMHTNDIVTLPYEVKVALDGATNIVLEANPVFSVEQARRIQDKIYRWASRQTFNEERFSQYLQSIKNNHKQLMIKQERYLAALFITLTPEMLFDINFRLQPPVMTASSLMSNRSFTSTQDTVEHRLIARASQPGYTLNYLETAESQTDKMFGFKLSYEQQLDFYFFVKSYVERGGKIFTGQELKEFYLQQNIDELSWAMKTPFPDASEVEIPSVVTDYYHELIAARDISLAESITEHLEAGDAFIAIGAGHLRGIIDTLESNDYEVEPITTGEFKYPIAGTLEENDKVIAFRRIYNALYAGQSSVLKSRNRGILETDDINIIIRHASANPASRTAKAWELANQHVADVSLTNTELFESIHRYSYQQSSSSFFKKSNNFGDASRYAEAEAIIAQADADSRTGRIRSALG